MKKVTLAAGLAATMIGGSAFAVDYTTNGNGVPINDDAYNGSLASMNRITLNVPDSVSITDIDVIVDIQHTWVGDLVWKLQSPAGTVVTLMSRPGYAEPADDGSGCCGNSGNLNFGSIYEIDDASGNSSENMTGAPGQFHSSGFLGDFQLTSLNGENSAGDWILYIGDGAAGDIGIFDGYTLQISGIPAPGALALLGLAGLAARRRRR